MAGFAGRRGLSTSLEALPGPGVVGGLPEALYLGVTRSANGSLLIGVVEPEETCCLTPGGEALVHEQVFVEAG
jgi:hypothetical protein